MGSFGNGGSKVTIRPTNKGPRCYKCKGYGHFAVACPTRDKKVAFICEKELLVMDEEEETEAEDYSEDIDSEGEHLNASTLPSCVINRVLTGEKKEIKTNPEWLRTNIFHT